MDRRQIMLEGLTKRYSEAVLAVDDLSFDVDEGEVMGLLGPNGAGKTTTMRMLLGLIHPSVGRVRLFGEVVRPGSPVLARVGALVESPGFVPHLSGLKNLQLFWEAGGAKPSQAHLDEALEVADLGEALHRKYKTYSHGMRQRLGLAQALMGSPDLLVLDEPTSGLDPHQMREIREMIRRVSARGTTILLSSHLLGEVEQVCDRAAVMNRGKLVRVGTVAELVGAATVAYIEVDDVARTQQLLNRMPGIGNVEREGPGLSVELVDMERRSLVAALVDAGIGLETLTARNRLEDAFIGLLEEASA